ncbi:hypothetical protein C1645_822647 [Glomus cerebriforme]|uniref:Uncharacterized protein n=1 Tax=Glomus cerebriforme TaxID=658196 RepID=A0A397SY39_9GLOM|nr:hypothetical protein C1645_822647 [Glomus cerebriforme]
MTELLQNNRKRESREIADYTSMPPTEEVASFPETVQTSSSLQANDQEYQEDQEDQEVDDTEIDKIIVSALLFTNLNLEEIWLKVMERLKKDNLRVQSIESRVVDLSDWTKIEWNRILKASDYSQLFIKSRKKLSKDKIDNDVQQLLRDGSGRMQSLNDLIAWKNKFINLETPSEDSLLIVEIPSLLTKRSKCPDFERDFIVKVLSPIIGTLLEEFDIGTFELNWIEKESRSVTNRKRKAMHEEYEDLTIMGNTEGPIDDTKYRKDHSKLKVVMKDCLDTLWSKLHFKKVELKDVFTLGIQISVGLSTPFHMIFHKTFILSTTLSDIEDLLPSFLENLLALRYTLLDQVKKIRAIAQRRLSTPSPPSSPLHISIINIECAHTTDTRLLVPENGFSACLYRDNHFKRCINRDTISKKHTRRKEILQSIDRREFIIWQHKQYILQEEAKMKRFQLELLSQSTPHSEKNKLASVSYYHDVRLTGYEIFAQSKATIAKNTMPSAPNFEPALHPGLEI